MGTRLKVVGHRVLLKPSFQTEKTEWGFDLSVGETHKRELAATEVGKIVSIGPNAWKAFDDGVPWAKVGDIIMFAKHGGKWVADPDNKDDIYFVINDDDVQCILEEA